MREGEKVVSARGEDTRPGRLARAPRYAGVTGVGYGMSLRVVPTKPMDWSVVVQILINKLIFPLQIKKEHFGKSSWLVWLAADRID
jgi:hypothetical protein